MADYAITAANVLFSGTGWSSGIAGEAVTAGQMLYKKASDGKFYKADSDAGSDAEVTVGMALCDAAIGQPVNYISNGEVTVGAAVFTAMGEVVALSDTAGVLCPVADVITGDNLIICGWSTATNKMMLRLINTEIEIP